MIGYILKRLVSAIPVLIGISIIVFIIMALIPGDPATAILGSFATPENVEKLNRDLGLDKPMIQRYFIWLGNMLQGDFGRSFSLNKDVLDEILERFGATLILAGVSFVLCSVLGVVAGALSASRQFAITDKLITLSVLIGISIPSFFLGMMMILFFSVQLRWFPVSGMWPIYGTRDIAALLSHLFLPAVALSVVATGVIARLSRSAMLEVLRQDFIRTARAKGLSETKGDLAARFKGGHGERYSSTRCAGGVCAFRSGLHRDGLSMARCGKNAGGGHIEKRHFIGAGWGCFRSSLLRYV